MQRRCEFVFLEDEYGVALNLAIMAHEDGLLRWEEWGEKTEEQCGKAQCVMWMRHYDPVAAAV